MEHLVLDDAVVHPLRPHYNRLHVSATRGPGEPSCLDLVRRESARFPDWFHTEIDHLASISTEMAGDRGIAFYGDERQRVGPQDLFDRDDATRAVANMDYVAGLCTRLLETAPGGNGDPR